MTANTSNKVLLVLICLSLPLVAEGQSTPWRIAYEFCDPWAGASGFETVCRIRVSDDQAPLSELPFGGEPVWSPDGLRIAAADAGDDATITNTQSRGRHR